MHIKLNSTIKTVQQAILQNYKIATRNFIFTFIFVNLFQMIFGAQNSIVGVIFVIIMPSSMLMDLTQAPIKNFFIQCFILEAMTVSAFLITVLNPYVAILINFAMLFFLLYVFTFEYVSDLYMPYILSYLFLVFISPVEVHMLPKRMIAILIGSICIILYQLVKGRHRVRKTVRSTLTELIDESSKCIRCLLSKEGAPESFETIHSNLCKLSHLIYARRKRAFHISDAEMSMIGCGLAMEKLIRALYDFEGIVTDDCTVILQNTAKQIGLFREFIQKNDAMPASVKADDFLLDKNDLGKSMYHSLASIQNCLVHMVNPEKRKTYRQTLLSLSIQMKVSIAASPVRIIYSLRVATLLVGLTLAVQLLQLPHGKWLLFTVASVSLPYADDVGEKAKKRFLATLIGGLISVIAFAFIPTMFGRTAVMLIFGYLTSYFTDYKFNFACSTVGALGGAVLMNRFGFIDVGGMFIMRIGYICLGIIIAYIANCYIFPFRRNLANGQLSGKFFSMYKSFLHMCPTKADEPQIYYRFIIQLLLQSEKLKLNIGSEEWDQIKRCLWEEMCCKIDDKDLAMTGHTSRVL